MIRCSACLTKMSRPDWDIHDCPATPAILDGESWAEFKTRSEAYAAAWRDSIHVGPSATEPLPPEGA